MAPTQQQQQARLVKPGGGARSNILELNEFRRGVGLCIYNAEGLVFTAQRVDDPERSWQMPQARRGPPRASLARWLARSFSP